MEVERLRAAAATEINHAEVKPIRTDFHFFVLDNKEKYKRLAEDEVRKSTKSDDLDPFLVNSNLNTRLMKAWEDLRKEERDAYMVKEEEDRIRFMEEDEIASRHCATLTARGKSPKAADKGKKEERQESGEATTSATPPRDAPNRKNESMDEEEEEDDSDEEGKEEEEEENGKIEDSETLEVDGAKKRLSPPNSSQAEEANPAEQRHESPPKRNRTADDVAV